MDRNRILRHFPAFAFILFVLIVWCFVSEKNIISPYVLPSPVKVFLCIVELVKTGEIWKDISISIIRIMKGFSIALIIALFAGFLSSFKPIIHTFIDDNVNFMKNVPPLCLVPLLILWFGIGETSKTLIIVLASFFPLYVNIVKGLTTTDEKLLEVGKVFGYSKSEQLIYIVFPNALPHVLSGIKIALGYSWRAIIASEMIASTSGIGHFIIFSQEMSRTDRVIAGIIIVGVTGCLTEKLVEFAINKILRRNAVYGRY